MPRLPLLPLWEKGVGGMRGKSASECRTSLISPKNSTFESGRPCRHPSRVNLNGARASRPPARRRHILAGMRAGGARTRGRRCGHLACVNLNGARASRLRRVSEGTMPSLPGAMRPLPLNLLDKVEPSSDDRNHHRAPHAATEMNFGLPSAGNGRLAPHAATEMMVFEQIIRYSPRRRALPWLAEGFSPTASALLC
jgi:hypothetical protein